MSSTFAALSYITKLDTAPILLAGACVQLLASLLLPPKFTVLPALALLISYGARQLLASNKASEALAPAKVLPGRWTARIYSENDSEPPDVTVFLVGVSINHPLGLAAPGFAEVAAYFGDIWKEAEADSKKSGYLGRTTPMAGTRAESKNTFLTVSYWRNVESLHAVALGPTHKAGWDWWKKTVQQHPHLGIFHEVYVVPKGQWTNNYWNMPRFGMGLTTIDGAGEESPLVAAKGSQWSGLLRRMRKADTVASK